LTSHSSMNQGQKAVASEPVSAFSHTPVAHGTITPKNPGASQAAEGSFIRLAIHMDQTQKVWVRVLDPNGLVVRNIFKGQWTAGDHTMDWDGKDDHGHGLASGTYQVTVQSGGRTQSTSVNLQQAQ